MTDDVSAARGRRREGVRRIFIGLLLLCVGLILFARLVLAVPLSGTWLPDLHPRPDGEEYFAGAMSLAHEGVFTIHVAGRRVPPRYPFGYSLLMVPILWSHVNPISAPFVVNRLVGLALIISLFLWTWRTCGPTAAGVAVLVTVTMPAFVILCRSPMSEVSACAVVLASMVGSVKGADTYLGAIDYNVRTLAEALR